MTIFKILLECTTISGPDPDKQCVFPFKYKNKTFHHCTTEDNESFDKILNKSINIFWNGPMGIFEKKEFIYGTRKITESISNLSGYTCIGGGDSVSAINKFSDKKYFNHISTGGGASLEYLEGKKLPGVNKYKSLIIW